MRRSLPSRIGLGARRPASAETGQVTILALGFAVVAILLVVGALGVTSVQLARVRLLDAADSAALDAADAIDLAAYRDGVEGGVRLSEESVRVAALAHLATRVRPGGLNSWGLAAGTGTPDGRVAVVRLVGEADLPLVGGALTRLGGSVVITVESRARAGGG